MSLRRRTEQWEREYLSPRAVLASETSGRAYDDRECSVRTAFQRDRDRILHSKAFRRLKSKTQVFIAPEGDHYRTRLTHTLEVSQISRTVARALRLNEDLTEAVALGHDLGHTPFGHAGEAALERLAGRFHHNLQSLRVVELLERHSPKYPGLNLTAEVREGILGHTGARPPVHLEGQIVRLCDRVAYLNHDVEDAVRGGILAESDIPDDVATVLGVTRSQRIDTMVSDMIAYSQSGESIGMTPRVSDATERLRKFLFQTVYIGSEAKIEEQKVYHILRMFFEYYLARPEELERRLEQRLTADAVKRGVIDYIAGMTDRYAISEFQTLFLPKGWSRR